MVDTSCLFNFLKHRLFVSREKYEKIAFEWCHFHHICSVLFPVKNLLRNTVRRYPDAVTLILDVNSHQKQMPAGRWFAWTKKSKRKIRTFPGWFCFTSLATVKSGTLVPIKKRLYHFCDDLKHVKEKSVQNCTSILMFSPNVWNHVVGISLKTRHVKYTHQKVWL